MTTTQLQGPAIHVQGLQKSYKDLEVLRGSASMLFGRGSTGGAVNQVSKLPALYAANEVAVTLGSGGFLRGTADLNAKTGDNAAFRINAMFNLADNHGARIDKAGIAPSFRWGIGTTDEFLVGLYHLDNHNGVLYGLPIAAAPGGLAVKPTAAAPGVAWDFVRFVATN